jgi:hypothetical protein
MKTLLFSLLLTVTLIAGSYTIGFFFTLGAIIARRHEHTEVDVVLT